jgi:hypothetical protein
VNIDKSMILDLLRGVGRDTQAQQADRELPEQVDTDEHAGLLEKLGVTQADLIAKITGSGSGGGPGGLLGELS